MVYEYTKRNKAMPSFMLNILLFLLISIFYFPINVFSQNALWVWGGNCSGQLGCANEMDCPAASWGYWGGPILIGDISNVNSIAAGGAHSLATDINGNVWAWGINYSGQLGTNNDVSTDYPVQVLNLTDVISVASGSVGSVALRTDGTVWQWGFFGTNPCWDCGPPHGFKIPVLVDGLYNIIAIAAGCDHAMALKNDGTVWAWGANYTGQLGDGTNIDSGIPVQVVGLTNVVAIDGGGGHSLALKNDGTVWTWGGVPAQVANLSEVVAISAGTDHSFAIESDGSLWAWGGNHFGQLGDGTTVNSTAPIKNLNLSNVTAISGGEDFSVAATSDGTVWAWGRNIWGELGNGTTNDSLLPVQVSNVNGIAKLSAGWMHTLALRVNPPVVGSIKTLKDPFRIKVEGNYFQDGLKVYIGSDLEPWPHVDYKNDGKIIINGGNKLKRKIPKGISTQLRFVNPDGGEATFNFIR